LPLAAPEALPAPMRPLVFDNRFVAELPGDPESANTRRQVLGAAWSRVAPTPVAAPRLLAWSKEVASLLDLDESDVRDPLFAEVFAGNRLIAGMDPIASNYGGHQFGVWAGQLGDGRAISLGEVVNRRGERWELQLKGAGPTPYSRHADGRAVLRSSVREFLCSEAMHHLGIPTTRALSLIATGEPVVRDMFYDGRPAPEPGAIVCRVAPSFIRLGHFELPAARGDRALLERLVDFTIDRDFPHLVAAHPADPVERRAAWFMEVCERTAVTIAHWMRVGFVHGVMNTDNLSVLGLTIDYGPYGWLDDFDPDFTPNTTDAQGRRYRYANQPAVGQWNLSRFGAALAPLFPDTAPLEAGLERYADVYTGTHRALTASKLGWRAWHDGDELLARELFELLHRGEIDHTLFFRALAEVDPGSPSLAPFADAFYRDAARERVAGELLAWLVRWGARVARDGEPAVLRRARMNAVNPRYVLRNYLAQQAIDAAEAGDPGPLAELLDVMRRPYDDQPGREPYAARRPEWARHRPGCAMLSCSS
jgi:uncharacterized protein YdiU (UPF0061 family)